MKKAVVTALKSNYIGRVAVHAEGPIPYVAKIHSVTREYFVDGVRHTHISEEEEQPIYFHEMDEGLRLCANTIALNQDYLAKKL